MDVADAAASIASTNTPPPSPPTLRAAAGDDPKRAAQRMRKREQRQALLWSMTRGERERFLEREAGEKVAKVERMRAAMTNGAGQATIALDLGYDHIMNDKEIKSLSKQIKFVYGSIKVMPAPFQLRLFHCSAQLRESLTRFSCDRWHAHWHDHDELTDVFAPTDLVYLSPDSPNVLATVDPSKTYVIGGIVDKSRKKGATLQAAEAAGIATARLPIQEHITERLDHILNVNTVVDVLIHFAQHGDWRRALTEVLPLRKQSAVGRRSKRKQLQRRDDGAAPRGRESQSADRAVEVDHANADTDTSDVHALSMTLSGLSS